MALFLEEPECRFDGNDDGPVDQGDGGVCFQTVLAEGGVDDEVGAAHEVYDADEEHDGCVFQYIDRKRGLAMLWSLGQTKQGLLRILILETARSFFLAALIGIPVSCLLCYNVYQVLRSTWRIRFMLPLKQIFLLIVAMITATLVAMIVEWCCMKRQNFLQNIKDEI